MIKTNDAWLAREMRRWMRPDAHRWLRPDHKRFLPLHEQKAGFNPDQPRVQAGNPDGGQWTGGDGVGASEPGSPAGTSRLDEFSGARRNADKGHHYVTREIFDDENLSKEARKVFQDATTGKLYNPRLNRFDTEHRFYSKAVKDLFQDFIVSNNIDKKTMTTAQAEQFLQDVLTSRDPRIRNFNRHMKMKELLYRVRWGIRGNE